MKQRQGIRAASGTRRGRCAGVLALGAVATVALALLLAGCGAPQPGQWDQMVNNASQPVYAVVQDPTKPNLIYAGGAGGVVYRLLAATTQQPVAGDGIASGMIVLALATDPAHAGRVYAAGTGGVYASTNYGDSWRIAANRGFPAAESMDALIVLPGSGALLAGTTQHGIFASTHGGASWQAADSGLPQNATINFFAQDPASHLLFTSVAGAGLFASSDGGASWAAHGTGLPANVAALASVTSGGATMLFAATDRGLFASTDGGATWQSHNGGGLPAGKLTALATDTRAPSALYAATTTTVYVSTDGGHTWKLLAPGLDDAVTQMAVVSGQLPQPVVVAAAVGLFRYPPPKIASGGIGSTILTIVLGGLMAVLALLFFMRSRRNLAAIERRNRVATQAAAQQRDRDAREGNSPQPPSPPRGSRAAPPRIRGYGSGGMRSDDVNSGAHGHDGGSNGNTGR